MNTEKLNILRARRSANSDKCKIDGCSSTAKGDVNISFHKFPVANYRFVYRPGDEPGKVEKTDMREVWKAVTQIEDITPRSKICSLHFTKSDYVFADTMSSRRTLKKNAVPSRRLPGNKCTLKIVSDIKFYPPTSQVLQENSVNHKSEEPAENIPMVILNRVCMFLKCIKNDEDLEMASGIVSFSALNTIIKIAGKALLEESDLMTSRNRILMTYIKLKQNLNYNFLAMLFNCIGAEQCKQIVHSTLKVLSRCFKRSISLPVYEEMSPSWPKHFSKIKIILDCIEIYLEGHNIAYKVIVGSSLGGFISYISEPFEKDKCNADIFQESNITKLLKPGDSIMLDNDLSFEELCSINGWKCVSPKTETERVYLGRFDDKLKNFGIMKSVIPDEIVPLTEELFIVICATLNINLRRTPSVVEVA